MISGIVPVATAIVLRMITQQAERQVNLSVLTDNLSLRSDKLSCNAFVTLRDVNGISPPPRGDMNTAGRCFVNSQNTTLPQLRKKTELGTQATQNGHLQHSAPPRAGSNTCSVTRYDDLNRGAPPAAIPFSSFQSSPPVNSFPAGGAIDITTEQYKVSESVTDDMPNQGSMYALAVTRAQCHKCGRNIVDSEPVYWWRCWCEGKTNRQREIYLGEQKGQWWYGPGRCFGVPQIFCRDCAPQGEFTEYKQHHCIVCRRIFYSQGQIKGYRLYCSDKCSNIRRAKREFEKRHSKMVSKTCLICGISFEPIRNDQDYCSGACKQKAYRSRHNGYCKPHD